MTQSFTAACQNECQSSLNWLFAGLMTIQGPEGTEGWGMSEDAGCWWVAVAFENEFLYATIHFGTVDACWCEDLWTSFSAIQAPWLPLGLVYWILLSYAFLHLVALEKGLYKRWPFVLFRDLHLEHDACSNFLPPTTSTQLWNQVEEHSFFQRMWSWASETAKWMLLDASDEVPHYNSILHVLDVFMYHGCSYLYTYIYNILSIYTSCPCFTGIIKHLPELRTKIYARHLLFFPTICHHFSRTRSLTCQKIRWSSSTWRVGASVHLACLGNLSSLKLLVVVWTSRWYRCIITVNKNHLNVFDDLFWGASVFFCVSLWGLLGKFVCILYHSEKISPKLEVFICFASLDDLKSHCPCNKEMSSVRRVLWDFWMSCLI